MNTASKYFDVTIIGGGLHGAAIAADCAGRGLRTLLCHRGELGASHGLTSKRLFHCGLQYLQRGDIARVNQSIEERQILAYRAPHLTYPTEVLIPQRNGIGSALKQNTKAFLYNLISNDDDQLESCNIAGTELAAPLQTANESRLPAVKFRDLTVNDSQLTIENLLLAQEKGAHILPHTCVTSAKRDSGDWQITLHDSHEDANMVVESRCIVNASGPAAEYVQEQILGISSRTCATNYQAAYVIVPSLFEGNQTYLLESNDQLISAVSYGDNFTLIGPYVFETTLKPKCEFDDLPDNTVSYLIDLVNQHFKKNITATDIVHGFTTFSSSYKETPEEKPTPFSQDYVLDFNCSDGKSPAVTLFGTCMNMHRTIAEQVFEQVSPYLNKPLDTAPCLTKEQRLPGNDFEGSLESFALTLKDSYPWLPTPLLNRWISTYGSRTYQLIGNSKSLDDLGSEIVPTLFEREIYWLHDQEWAITPQSIIWHRTKLGLELTNSQINQFYQWFNGNFPYRSPILGLQLSTELNQQAS